MRTTPLFMVLASELELWSAVHATSETVGEWRRRVAPDAREKKRKTVGWEMRGGNEGKMRGRKNKGNNDRLWRRDKGESGTSHGGKSKGENEGSKGGGKQRREWDVK